MQKFVDKYLHDFYLPDNHVFLQSQFVIFRQLLSWMDPVLSVHLESIGFSPDLYSLSWFLTLFARK
jgi:TBC domain-containing protein kinase-like protein